MSPADELKIARFVYPDNAWQLYEWQVENTDGEKVYMWEIVRILPINLRAENKIIFNPSPTGSDAEKSQALDTILAATRIGNECYITRLQYTQWNFMADDDEANTMFHIDQQPDILTAAKAAIAEYLK